MGDFEDVFGAGADFDAIVESFSRSEGCGVRHALGYDVASDAPIELQDSKSIPVARDFAPKPPANFFVSASLSPRDCQSIARETLAPIESAIVHAANVPIAAILIRDAVNAAINGYCKSDDDVHDLLSEIVKEIDYPIVLALDRSSSSGYLHRWVCTHALIFDDRVLLARFGGGALQGPFLMEGGESRLSPIDHIPRFSTDRMVVSASRRLQGSCARSPNLPQDAQTSIAESVYDEIALYAAISEGGQAEFLRSWSDSLERRLKSMIRLISAALDPEEFHVTVKLTVGLNDATISASSRPIRGFLGLDLSALECALQRLLDLAAFRGRVLIPLSSAGLDEASHAEVRRFDIGKFSVVVFNSEESPFTMDERERGANFLIDLAEMRGYERNSIAYAISKRDMRRLRDELSSAGMRDLGNPF